MPAPLSITQAFCNYARAKIDMSSDVMAAHRDQRRFIVDVMSKGNELQAASPDFAKIAQHYVTGVHAVKKWVNTDANVAYFTKLLGQFHHRAIFLQGVEAEIKKDHFYLKSAVKAFYERVQQEPAFDEEVIRAALEVGKKGLYGAERKDLRLTIERVFNATNPVPGAVPVTFAKSVSVRDPDAPARPRKIRQTSWRPDHGR